MDGLRLAASAIFGAACGVTVCWAAYRTAGDEAGEKRTCARAIFCFCGVLGGCVSVALLFRYPDACHYCLSCLAAGAGLFHAVTDWLCGYIYDRAVIATSLAGLVLRFACGGMCFLPDALYGAAAGAAPLAFVIVLTRGAMGWGDVTMMAGLGAVLGWKMSLLTLYFGVIFGGAAALLLLIIGRVRRRDALPLAPFVFVGLLCALFFGEFFIQKIGVSVALF